MQPTELGPKKGEQRAAEILLFHPRELPSTPIMWEKSKVTMFVDYI